MEDKIPNDPSIEPELKEKMDEAVIFRDKLKKRYPEIFADGKSFISLDFIYTPQHEASPAKFRLTVAYSQMFPKAVKEQFQEYLEARFNTGTWSEFSL